MTSARDFLDDGIEALGLLGQPADLDTARDRFRRASSMDPSMCDAWLGLVAAGDQASDTLRHAHDTSVTLHRETRRLGLQDTALGAAVSSPGFIDVFPYTPASITLAYIAALLTDREYDAAEKLLEDFDTTREPQQSPIWRCLGATLHYVTQRWTDVLDWAARPVSAPLPVVDAATDLMAGIAHIGLGQFDVGLDRLDRVQTDQLSRTGAAHRALYRGLALRALGRDSDARAEFAKATHSGQTMPQANEALADPTYGPVVTTAEAIAARTSPWDPRSGPSTDDLRRAKAAETAKAVLDQADRELESFIGLQSVKAHINKLKYVQLYDRALAARGEGIGQRNALHMTLVGPPGTAKTSIARIMGKIYFGLGQLKTEEFIEVTRKDLVGAHIGETEEKTGAILNRARGGVLFVDEAYSLYKADNERDFGRIALDVIMQFAEAHRDDIMIAFAGYAGKMSQLMTANPGLPGRFPTQLEFSSYSCDELAEIANVMADSYRVLIDDDATNIFNQVTNWLTTNSTGNLEDPAETLIDTAGNGRFVRNVLSEAVQRMKARYASDTSIDLATADLNMLRTVSGADMSAAIQEVLASAGIRAE
ncbi:AAA family ATPase [Mycolicibacterium conceptionense]|uniref:AAA family ATPase n=1 Tax=Mycolicibacterium conceptionense TaxID=451644 RepID=UPI00320464BB